MQRSAIGVGMGVLLVLAGCGSSDAGTTPSAGAVEQGAVGGAGSGPGLGAGCGSDAEAREVAEDPRFELRASPQGPYVPGQQGRFEIALTPRGNFHVNTQYPLSVRLAGPAQVRFPRAELGPEQAAELGEPRARFDVPFTASAAGRHRVTAAVDFAVCTPESCMPECRTLALVLPVEAAQAGTDERQSAETATP